MKRWQKLRGWRAWAVVLLAVASAAGLGFVAAFFVLEPITPPTLAAPQSVTNTPVVFEDSIDEHSVKVAVRRSADVDLFSQGEGVVTASSCVADSTIASGASVHSIDGRPVVLLGLSSPLWRNISLGDEGSDVVALKAELERLGFKTTSGKTLNWTDLESVRSLLKQAGAQSDVDSVAMPDFMWMPSSELTVTTCQALVGQRVEQDTPILSINGGAVAEFVEEPMNLLSGARVLRIDDSEIFLADDLSIPAESIPVILATSLYATAAAAPEATAVIELAGTITLVDAVSLASLPPSAITVVSAVDGCVSSGTTVYEVRVVTSELGRTIVQFIDKDVPEYVTLEAPSACM